MLSEKRSRIFSRFSIDQLCFIVLALSICFKLIYAVRVPYNISPHDLNLTSDWTNIPDGHLGYIQYIYQYRQLTDFSPVEYPSQYYHPPLFYIMSAVIMSVFDPIKNNNLTASFEAIQFFNMLTASVIPVVCYFIFKELKIKGQGLLWATLMVSFSPALYHIGAAINSDCLMSFFLSLVVLNAVKWANSPRMTTIAKMGLFLALSMLSKTSGVLIAPALSLLFLWSLLEKKAPFKELFAQYLVFGLISIPLGLSWVLRENILFGMPFNYVLEQTPDSFQYVGDCSLIARIGLPSVRQLSTTKIVWSYRQDYSNIWGQTLFSMCLDEGILPVQTDLEYYMVILLYWMNSILYIISFFTLLKSVFLKKYSGKIRAFFIAIYLTLMGSYILFAFQQPFICTMNFRYIWLTLVPLFSSVGILANDSAVLTSKLKKVITTVLILCSFYTGIVYIVLAT